MKIIIINRRKNHRLYKINPVNRVLKLSKGLRHAIKKNGEKVSIPTEITYYSVIKKAKNSTIKEIYNNWVKEKSGSHPQPKSYYFNNEEYKLVNKKTVKSSVKVNKKMQYLQKLAWYKMEKWDKNNPTPIPPESMKPADKIALVEHHKKLRRDTYSRICTNLLIIYNKKQAKTYYQVSITKQDPSYPFTKIVTVYSKNHESLNKAETDFVNKTLNYMTNKDKSYDNDYRRTDLYKISVQNGVITKQLLDFHTTRRPSRLMYEHQYKNFVKNLKVHIAGNITVPFKFEYANAA